MAKVIVLYEQNQTDASERVAFLQKLGFDVFLRELKVSDKEQTVENIHFLTGEILENDDVIFHTHEDAIWNFIYRHIEYECVGMKEIIDLCTMKQINSANVSRAEFEKYDNEEDIDGEEDGSDIADAIIKALATNGIGVCDHVHVQVKPEQSKAPEKKEK